MIGKDFKKYSLLSEILPLDIFSESDKYLELIENAIAVDYGFGAEVWDYYLTINDKQLAAGTAIDLLVERTSAVFKKADESRFGRVLSENDAIRNAYYRYASGIFNDSLAGNIANLLASNKVDAVDAILKMICKNPDCGFSDFLYSIVDKQISILREKSKDGKISMQKKVRALIMDYVKKLKASQAILINQRLKEI